MILRVGDILPTTRSGDVEVVEVSGGNATVRFLETGNIQAVVKANLVIGKVLDRCANAQNLKFCCSNKPTCGRVGRRF
jgi:hypothetical protein